MKYDNLLITTHSCHVRSYHVINHVVACHKISSLPYSAILCTRGSSEVTDWVWGRGYLGKKERSKGTEKVVRNIGIGVAKNR